MNTEFLGDEMDHWKGSLILILTKMKLIFNVAVDPMVTDHQPWSEVNLLTYRRLLHLGQVSMICHADTTFSGRRKDYFAGIQHAGDLFLDPDTGISTGQASRRHITVPEICGLLNCHVNRKRVLMIYQHSARGDFHERLTQIGNMLLENCNQRVRYCVYQARRVAMFFISQNKKQIRAIQDYLCLYINDIEGGKVWGNGHIA
jgi:hypothetical protein